MFSLVSRFFWHKAGSERRKRKTAEGWLKSEHRNRWVDGEDSASPPMENASTNTLQAGAAETEQKPPLKIFPPPTLKKDSLFIKRFLRG